MVYNLKSPSDLSGFYIVYNGATQNEEVGFRGVSHLMEHLIHGMNKSIYSEFDKYAISNNAYTTNSEIVFYITGLDKLVNKFKYKFLDNILSFNVSKKTFLNERSIVIQEYLDYFDQQPFFHHEHLFRKYFNFYGPIGYINDLKKLTYEKANEFYSKYFSYPTSIINVSKSYPFIKELKYSTNKEYKEIEWKDNPNYKIQDKNHFNKISIISISKNIIKDDYAIVDFITGMLSEGLNSPLYKLIREKYGLVYNLSMLIEPITNDNGVLYFQTLTDDIKSANKIEKILSYVLEHPEKYLTEERFKIFKQLNRIELAKDNINRFANIGKYIMKKEWYIENYLDTITLDEVLRVYKKYFNNWHYSVDKVEFI